MIFELATIVLVRFPFTDLTTDKKRPAVVISPSEYQTLQNDVVLLALTTKPQHDNGLKLEHWQTAGLPRESWLKPIVGTFAIKLVVSTLGVLPADDWNRLEQAIGMAIAADFLRTG